MKRLVAAAAMLLLFSISALSQGLFATVTGTVTDSSGALVPGVTIKATAVDTGVITTTLTNEAGAYNFSNLLPGKYTIAASLPGFQTNNLTDAQLSPTTTYRFNFRLAIAGVTTQVEVTLSAETILSTQGASVGQVLSQQKVQDLPLVGRNILDLITVMAGVETMRESNPLAGGNAFNREDTTFAGIRADNISVVRDGIQVQDNGGFQLSRNSNGISSVTTINPDLVGEIRLILAPVDVELGRGNGSISYTTRSGTNRYSGSVNWSFRNTALDPNSWTNNRNQTIPANQPAAFVAQAQQGLADLSVDRNWTNSQQLTVSYGGPIVRNKTFFFALFDMGRIRSRTLENFAVLTPCARLGIFRYYNGWTNGNGLFGADGTGSNATRKSVNLDGSPAGNATGLPSGSTVTPPPGQTYDGSLQAASVFGPLTSKPSTNDCSGAAINTATLVPNGAIAGWDANRKRLDPTGYITRAFAFYPTANNYEIGDGLNTAGYRYLRPSRGVDNLAGTGEATGDREQYNVKIDHNFSSNHKANVNVSYELVDSDDVLAGFPNTFSNLNYRRPLVVSGGFTSTLSSSMVNEARFGLRKQVINVVAPWHRDVYNEDLEKLFPADVDGLRVIPDFAPFSICNPHSGARPPTGPPAATSGCIFTGTSFETSPSYTYSDTVSWTHGAHSFRFNGEFRFNKSKDTVPTTSGFGQKTSNFLGVTGVTTAGAGNFGILGTTPGTGGPNDFAGTNTALWGLTTGNGGNGRALMGYLAGTVTNVQSFYRVADPKNTTVWTDGRSGELFDIAASQREFSAFAKDDWKITKDLTLTPGIRWDYYGVPWADSGLTIAAAGSGGASFGISGRDFTGWMKPGVRADPTTFELVGPKSPNPGKSVYRKNYGNFGPAFAFAWQVPWFGEGKTTVRGGYQITYQGGGRFGTTFAAISGAPGTTFAASFVGQNVYVDLTNLATAIPTPNVAPLQPLLTTGPRNQNFTTFDPNYTSPYVQNLTLSVTRSINRNVTLDARYIGTLSRKNYTSVNLNENNFLFNGLFEALQQVRTGTEITKNAGDPLSLLDQIFKGVNLCSVANSCTALTGGRTYGAIGTTTGSGATALYQTAALQMRSSGTYNANLANGTYSAVANSISTANGNLTGLPTGTVGAALRLNGFPDNFIKTNPQFGTMTYQNNSGYSNYHSLQVQVTTRPIQGFSGSATYNWSKNLGLLTTFTNPVDRAQDYTNIGNNPGHTLRTNGLMELPIGPNKLLMGNSSGWLARAVERWQLGMVYNLSSGVPTSITATSMLYQNGLPDMVYPVDFNKIKGVRWGVQAGNFLEGRYFDNNDMFVKIDDPSCFNVTPLQNLNGLAPTTGAATLRCTLDALAMAVPAGTAGAVNRPFNDGVTRPSVIVLQHPQPGKKGNLGNNTLIGLGSWRFDANLSKTFRITESKSLAVRIDAQNVMNHPQPGNPSLTIAPPGFGASVPFGQINNKGGGRLMQGSLRLSF